MSEKKPMTVEEMACDVCKHIGTVWWCICGGNEEKIILCNFCKTKQALLTHASQQVEEATKPLLEALRKLLRPTAKERRGWTTEDLFNAAIEECDEALSTHHAKYPKKEDKNG